MKSIIFASVEKYAADVYAVVTDELCDEVRALSEEQFSIDIPDEADEDEGRDEVEEILGRFGFYSGVHYNFI